MRSKKLCSVVKTLIVSGAGRTDRQGILLNCSGQLKRPHFINSYYSRNLLQSLAQISILYFFWSRPILSALRTFPWTDCEDFEDCASGGLQGTWDTVCSQIEFSSWIRPFKWGHLIQWHRSASQMYELGGNFHFLPLYPSSGRYGETNEKINST